MLCILLWISSYLGLFICQLLIYSINFLLWICKLFCSIKKDSRPRMIKPFILRVNQMRFKGKIFLDLSTKRICLKSHVCFRQNCLNKSKLEKYFHSLMILVQVSKLQSLLLSQQSSNIHLADVIVSIVRRNIVSVSGMDVNAQRDAFALTATINQLSPEWKWMWSNFGKYHTCSATFQENVERLIF